MTEPESAVHFLCIGTETPEWATPQGLFDELDKEFGFTLDVCALPENAKCDRYFTPEIDGLSQDWTGTCWMNPPYGKVISHWIRKAYESCQTQEADCVVCLLPVRTDTRWFHELIYPAQKCGQAEIRFIKGRLKFGGAKSAAPFPNMLVIYRRVADSEAKEPVKQLSFGKQT